MKTGNIGVTTENIFPIIKKFLYIMLEENHCTQERTLYSIARNISTCGQNELILL